MPWIVVDRSGKMGAYFFTMMGEGGGWEVGGILCTRYEIRGTRLRDCDVGDAWVGDGWVMGL